MRKFVALVRNQSVTSGRLVNYTFKDELALVSLTRKVTLGAICAVFIRLSIRSIGLESTLLLVRWPDPDEFGLVVTGDFRAGSRRGV